MEDTSRIKGVILDFPSVSAQKKKARANLSRGSFNDEMVNQVILGQDKINKEYKMRSKNIVKRLRSEVLTELTGKDKKR